MHNGATRRDMLNSPGDEAKREEDMKFKHEVKKAVKRKHTSMQEKVEAIEGKGKKPFKSREVNIREVNIQDSENKMIYF